MKLRRENGVLKQQNAALKAEIEELHQSMAQLKSVLECLGAEITMSV